jgi:hypothetical protein
LLYITAALLFILVSASCSRRERITTDVGFDDSVSFTAKQRKDGIQMLSRAADRILPSKTPVKVWFFSDRKVADPKFTLSVSGGRDFAPLADFYIRNRPGNVIRSAHR